MRHFKIITIALMIRRILIVTLLLFPILSFAWSYTGHVVIAQIAYDNLTPAAKTQVDKDTQAFYMQLPHSFQEKLNNHYPNVATFVKLAALPDMIRNWKLLTISDKFNAPLPTLLLPYAVDKTGAWHYINNPYPKGTTCQKTAPAQNVTWAIALIKKSIAPTNSNNTNGLLLAFLSHLVGDAHQPLHTISRYNGQCANDKGANLYCLKYSIQGQCTRNLHSLWDSGLGIFKTKVNVQLLAYKIEQAEPKSALLPQMNDINSLDWLAQEYQYASFIYSTPPGTKPTPLYYKTGQKIVKQQVALAGYRLALILNQILGPAYF